MFIIGGYDIRTAERWCKTKTVFRLKGDPEGSWLIIKAPFSDRVREHIARKYGDRVEEIANERYAAA